MVLPVLFRTSPLFIAVSGKHSAAAQSQGKKNAAPAPKTEKNHGAHERSHAANGSHNPYRNPDFASYALRLTREVEHAHKKHGQPNIYTLSPDYMRDQKKIYNLKNGHHGHNGHHDPHATVKPPQEM